MIRKKAHALARIFGLGLALAVAAPQLALANKTVIRPTAAQPGLRTYSADEMIDKGHAFFGGTTRDLASVMQSIFERKGEPTAYIVGQEAAGAFFGGLRYGEGTIYYKSGIRQHIYWQGPSVGVDFGGNGSRSLVLVYNSRSPRDLDGVRFGGPEGAAYIIGGFGINYQTSGNLTLVPIRTGVGARLGANLGYLKYMSQPTWNPF